MEKEAALPNDFPTDGVELRCFLVVSNYARSLAFYRDVLGARVLHELPGTLCFLNFAGSQILLSAPLGSRSGKTDPPSNHTGVISELSIRVPDCSAARIREKRMRTEMATQTMQAIQIHSYGGPEQLKLEEKPRPEPQVGEVLLRVHAAGVNQLDWRIRQGLMKDFQPVTFPYTPGIEAAGVVEDVGPAVTAFKRGQAVLGQTSAGAYAEYITIPVEALALKPQTLSFAEAATVPVGATTAWRALFDHGGLISGQRVLIVGAAGGMGLFAVQLAKWKSAQVIGTTSTANVEFVHSLGDDTVVDYTTTPIESVVQEVDLVLDGVGGKTLLSSLAALRRGGTLISLAGPPPREQAQTRGVRAMMSRGAANTPLQALTQLIDEGHLKVTVGKTFALSEVQQAHEYSQSDHGRGRIVLCIVEEGLASKRSFQP
jgi:NADPH:quinone reductase-like Zn-dependent oxidoreductase